MDLENRVHPAQQLSTSPASNAYVRLMLPAVNMLPADAFLDEIGRDCASLRKRNSRCSIGNRGYMSKPTDLVQGTLDLLLLKIVALQPLHGWAIAQRLTQVSGDVLQVSEGSLYPALHKLEQEGWITAKWQVAETGRRAK